MAAVLVDVADAVKDELASITGLVLAIDPERSYADWDEQLEDLSTLRVDVVPVNVGETELDSRGESRFLCHVDIGVRYRFAPEERESTGRITVSEIDDLLLLLQQFHDHFVNNGEGRRLTSYTAAAWTETNVRTWYVREHLREMGQYTGIVRVTYEAVVAHA